MARRLTSPAAVLAFAATLCAAGTLRAQVLSDPTRPPGNADYGGNGSISADSGLQSIIRPVGAKPRALINGVVVPLGGMVGTSRLAAINADSVVLVDADGRRETLALTPGIRKTAPHTQTSVPR